MDALRARLLRSDADQRDFDMCRAASRRMKRTVVQHAARPAQRCIAIDDEAVDALSLQLSR
jgi:hypothetical protein